MRISQMVEMKTSVLVEEIQSEMGVLPLHTKKEIEITILRLVIDAVNMAINKKAEE